MNDLRHIPGTVGDLHSRALTLPAATLWSWAVTGSGPAEAGSHSSAISVSTGCPWRPRAKAPIYGEISGLESKCKHWCQKRYSRNTRHKTKKVSQVAITTILKFKKKLKWAVCMGRFQSYTARVTSRDKEKRGSGDEKKQKEEGMRSRGRGRARGRKKRKGRSKGSRLRNEVLVELPI